MANKKKSQFFNVTVNAPSETWRSRPVYRSRYEGEGFMSSRVTAFRSRWVCLKHAWKYFGKNRFHFLADSGFLASLPTTYLSSLKRFSVWILLDLTPILVNFPGAIWALPCQCDVMPLAVCSRHTGWRFFSHNPDVKTVVVVYYQGVVHHIAI